MCSHYNVKVANLASFPSLHLQSLLAVPLQCAKRLNAFHSKSLSARLAQGATEYLVLLAVVLLVALIGVALVGFVPSVSSDAKIAQSDQYWRGMARPFAILDQKVLANGTVTLVVQNKDALGTYRMTRLNVSSGAYTTSTTFGSGETKTLVFSGAPAGTANTYYDFQVNISYTSPFGIAGVQRGTKSILGKYS